MIFRPATIVFLTILLLRSPAIPIETGVVEEDIRTWNTLSTRHFDVHYPAGMESLAVRAAELAESGYIRVANRLAHEITATIPLAVYPAGHIPDMSEADNRTTGLEASGHGIHVYFNGSYAELQRSIVTGMTRSFFYSMAGDGPLHYAALRTGRMPYWISEGMARYLASGFDGQADIAVRDIMERNLFLGIRELNDLKGERADEASAEGQAFCYYIENTFGKTALGELARNFLNTSNPDDAIRDATGKTIEDLERDWGSSLKKRYRLGAPVQKPGKTCITAGTSARFMIPAASPDGTKIAAFRVHNGTGELLILDAPSGHIISMRHARTLLKGGICNGITPVAHPYNRLSWSPDGRTIVLAGKKKGSPCLAFLDTVSGRIVDSKPLPFSLVKDPSLSADGKYLVFSAVAGTAEDIYILDRNRNTISRITDDDFHDRYPVLSPDGGSVIFSSNWNTKGNPSSVGYRIYQIDIRTGRRTELISAGESNIQGEISPDGKKLLFISEGNGFRRLCVYDFAARTLMKLKDHPSKADNPRWLKGSQSFIFTAPNGTDNYIYAGTIGDTLPYDLSRGEAVLSPALYRESYVDPREYVFHQYQPIIRPEYLKLGSGGTMDDGYLCYLRAGLGDYMGRHRLVLEASYIREPHKNDVNASLAYYLRISRAVLGFGLFRQSSPLDANTLETIYGLSQNPSFGVHGMEHYGGHISARIGLHRSFDFTITGSAGRYEKSYHYPDMNHNLRMTFGALSCTGEYNTERRGLMAPVRGSRLRITAEHAFDFIGKKDYTRLGADFRHHFFLDRHVILLLHGAGGTLVGTDNGKFKHYLGGFGSLRGYELNSISGRNMFLFNAELLLTPVDWNTFGLPLRGGLGNFAFVMFFDAGSAWDGMYRFVDKKTGRLDDLKMDFGAGLRMAVSPLLILKLDFAWPFDNKSIRQTNMLLSIGFDF
ncbi:MAG TPA: BamA/TamA family outer membrane protein [Spirochaetota bacterium]|nr:BamA/TamA family outer membrane protein [Spirochaetota bacterium]HPV40668.1 BamA/TamA family outer membrane protein [Spirochaetota bacterium]